METGVEEIFVSYARDTNNDIRIIDNLKKITSKMRGIELILDENHIGPGESIKKFIERLGKGEKVIIVFSDAYAESVWCMSELLEIYKTSRFSGNVCPIVVGSCDLHDDNYRTQLREFWKSKETALNDKYRTWLREFWKNKESATRKSQQIRNIVKNLDDMLDEFADLKFISFDELKDNKYSDIKNL